MSTASPWRMLASAGCQPASASSRIRTAGEFAGRPASHARILAIRTSAATDSTMKTT